MHHDALSLPIVFLLAAVIAVPLFKRFGFGAVLAYLAAGVLLGPAGLRIISDPERILAASEIGVVMMLFLIGLELSITRLKVMRRPIFVSGGLQWLVSAVALALLGELLGLSDRTAFVVGAALAMSSTAVGLQLLAERKELLEEHGRLAFAILLLQDLVAIPLLAAVPLLGSLRSEEGLSMAAFLKAVGGFLALLLIGRIALKHLFRIVARTSIPEVFTGASLLVVLGSAWLMANVGLSAGLGAFIAGVLLAESEFRHELESQIEPFKGLLLGLFFIAVGMSVNMDVVVTEPVRILVMLTLLVAVKFAVLYGVGRFTGKLNHLQSLQLAAVLATGGEFAFVILNQAVANRLIEQALNDQLVAVVSLSMALTPIMVSLIGRLVPMVHERARIAHRQEGGPVYDDIPADAGANAQVMIAGFGRFGQIVGRFLTAHKIRYVAIDNSAEQVSFMRRFGNTLYYGDSARPGLLRAAGGANIKVFVIALEKSDDNKRTVRIIRRMYPEAKVFARARDRQHAWELMDMGAIPVREMFFSSMELSRQVLEALGSDPETAKQRTARFARWDEKLLQDQFLIYDDPEQLRNTAGSARKQLEELFDADASVDKAIDLDRTP